MHVIYFILHYNFYLTICSIYIHEEQFIFYRCKSRLNLKHYSEDYPSVHDILYL